MAEEQIKEWVEKKLDQGVDDKRIRQLLEEKGYDPDIVDEVKDPFEKKDSDLDLEPEKEDDSTQETVEEDGSGFEIPNLPLKQLAIGLTGIAVIGLALAFVPTDTVTDITETQSSPAAEEVECPDTGMLIEDYSLSDETVAIDVVATREDATLFLELDTGESRTISHTGEETTVTEEFDSTPGLATLRVEGCEDRLVEQEIS